MIKFSRLFSENRHHEKLPGAFFTTKVSTLISVEGDKTLSRSLNDKIPYISVITCYRHYTKTFSLKLVLERRWLSHFPTKMTLVRARTLLSIRADKGGHYLVSGG